MSSGWTTPADIRARARRRWTDGALLRAYAAGEPFPVIDVPLRGPRVSEIGADLASVQEWVAALLAGGGGGARYLLEHEVVGGRAIGRNELPRRARIASYDQAWALLGVGREVARLDRILEETAAEPAVLTWATNQPLKAIAFDGDWRHLLAAYRWLDSSRGSGRYLREITAPGVDTKFVERHRTLLAALLDVPTAAPGFLAALGLQARPEQLRLRLDPGIGVLEPLTDVTAPVEDLRRLRIQAQSVVIVENEVTFLSLPTPRCGVVVWGRGFEVDRAGSLPWLRDAEVHYWGDLDSHGFAILHRLRASVPQTRSFLMDRETLLAHRDRWVSDTSPTRARLDRLTTEESDLYEDLVGDRFGDKVRLEQERIDWAWAAARLPFT